MYKSYEEQLLKLYTHHPELVRNFTNSIFPAATFNMGPNTVSLGHTDAGNVPGGMCALTALGSYNYKLGGHLILFDLRLVIEFPPGATILLPSGTLRHGNTTIQKGESRYSFAQYCAGGLLRWVSYGFRTAAELVETEGIESKLAVDGEGDSRWRSAVELFSKFEELADDHKKIFGRRR